MGYVEDYTKRLQAIQASRLMSEFAPPVASRSDIANMILQKARSDFSVHSNVEPPKKGKSLGGHLKSFGLGVLDVLSRPQYSVVEALDEIKNEGGNNPLKGAWEGITGKEKTDWIDYIQHDRENKLKEQGLDDEAIAAEMRRNRASDIGVGITADLILDPLNAIPGLGVIRGALKGPSKVVSKLDEAEDLASVKVAETPDVVASAPPQSVVPEAAPTPLTDNLLETISKARETSPARAFDPDIRHSDLRNLTKSRVIDDSGKILDQASKGNSSAINFLSTRNMLPLSPVARASVQQVVKSTENQIRSPKFKATNYSPSVVNNLSKKLLDQARKQLTEETKLFKHIPKDFNPQLFHRYTQLVRNAEESMIDLGRTSKNDSFFPKLDEDRYLRFSDVLQALPEGIARKAIIQNKIAPSTIMKAIGGDSRALRSLSKYSNLVDAIKETDWVPLMTRDYATRVMETSNKIQETSGEVSQFLKTAMGTVSSDAQKAQVMDDVVDVAKKGFKKEMPAARTVLKDTLDGLRKGISVPVPSAIQGVIDANKAKLAKDVFNSKSTAGQAARIETAASVAEEVIGEAAEFAATDISKAAALADAGIFATVMGWVDTSLGYKDLRPLLMKNIGARRASATTRANMVTSIFGKIPETEHLNFWHEVIGLLPPVAGHEVPVALMQKQIHNLFGESGLAEKFAGNTAISRAGINVDHLNKHLRIVGVKNFKFEKTVKDPTTGEKIELEPHQILNSWKYYQPKDSKELRIFAFNLTQAVENAMVEYSTFAQLGAVWGSKAAKADHIQVTGMHPAIEGMYFPKEIAPQIGKMAIGIDSFTDPLATGKFLKLYDSALRTWKSGVTIYSPSHHIRNLIGDTWLAWLDGLSDPRYYTKAGRVLVSQRHNYSDIEKGKNPLRDILGEGREAEIVSEIMGQSSKGLPKGTSVAARIKVGKKKYELSNDQVYQLAFRHGILPHSSVIEDLPGSETLMETLAQRFHPGKLGPFAPAKGTVAKKAREFSESREHFGRMAHWLYALENSKGSSLDEILETAAGRVRKYHPDGLDLTMTEKKVFRRLMPFYSWNRKAIPLIVEGLFTNPAKITAYPKVMSGLQESQGIDSSVSDPWPDDQLFPDWLSGNVIGPMLPPDNPFARAIARSDDEVGYTLINPGVPGTDILEDFFNNPVKGIGNQITPAIKLPAEIAFGQEFQSGAPIKDKTEYIDKNVPLLSTISRLTHGGVGTGLVEGGDLKGKETEPFNIAALINFLTAAGILDTGRYEKGGEFDLKKRLAEERKKQNGG